MKTLNVKKMSMVSNLITPYKKIGFTTKYFGFSYNIVPLLLLYIFQNM